MPVDAIKIQSYERNVVNYFRNHPLLEWLGEEEKLHHLHEDEIVTKVKKQYQGIGFFFYNDKVDIIFKPHYYFNRDIHNANDFRASDCIKVIQEFERTFEIDLSLLPIVNLEFGVNLLPPFDVKDVVTYLYSHGRNEFRSDAEFPFSKKSCTYNAKGQANKFKVIKCYAKGLQQPGYCHNDTFRFEYKSTRSKRIHKLAVSTMADLLSIDGYYAMADLLRVEFQKILFLDDTADFQNLTPYERKCFEKYLNPNNWYRFLQKSRNVFANNFKKFESLQSKSNQTMKAVLTELLTSKLNELIDV